jgi:4-hydroxy-tetrahydrodipicolinate reductase
MVLRRSEPTGPIRVGVIGLGPIGIEVARALHEGSRDLELAAAVDLSTAIAGRPLDEVIGRTGTNLVVDPELAVALSARSIEAVALCTGSRLESVLPDLEMAVEAGVHVVSSCEEMSSPTPSPDLRSLDLSARASGLTLVGTGVNPGFVMDRLVLQLAGAMVRVDTVDVERVVDAALRRGPLRKKVGEGLSVEEFRRGVADRRLGHVGLGASAELVARGLGSSLERGSETIDPVVDEATGKVLGLRQRLEGTTADGRPITMRLQMSVGAPEPHDRIRLGGDPPLDVLIAGGTQGDRATVGALLDGLRRVRRAPRGLVTVVDLYA